MINSLEMLFKRQEQKDLLDRLKNHRVFQQYTPKQDKIYLLYKYCTIYIVCFILNISYVFTRVSYLTDFYVILYANIFYLTRIFQYVILSEIIHFNLKHLNNEVSFIIKFVHSSHTKIIRTQLKRIQKSYTELHEITQLINYVSSYSMLCLSLSHTFSFIGITYMMLVGFLKNIQLIDLNSKYSKYGVFYILFNKF